MGSRPPRPDDAAAAAAEDGAAPPSRRSSASSPAPRHANGGAGLPPLRTTSSGLDASGATEEQELLAAFDLRSSGGAAPGAGGAGAAGLGGLLRRLFSRGADLEAARTHHRFTRSEKRRLAAFESIDYLAPSSRAYRAWLAAQPWRRTWDRWAVMAAIGAAVGALGFSLHLAVAVLAGVKYHATRWLLAHTHVLVGWLFNLAYSAGLVYCSTRLVVDVAPEAAGAGVAEVMAYLNGVAMPRVLSVRTLWVKFLSAAAAVGSGLPVGPEGPMIHMGAIVGAALSQGGGPAGGAGPGGWLLPARARFRNPKDKRDFVTAGAAVGVAAAFSAPVGGLLFVWEEVASFWQQALGWQIFFACLLAVLTLDTLRSAQGALRQGTFGLFDKEASTVFFEVQTQLTNHVAATLPAAVCGLLAGGGAIAFTFLNLRVARARAAALRTRAARMAEPLVIICLFVTAGMILPLFFSCTPTQCVIMQGSSTPLCPEGTPPRMQRIVEESMELYTCSTRGGWDSAVPAEWDPDGDGPSGNVTIPRAYNELATLVSVTGEDAIRHLFSRGTHRQFGYAALVVMLGFYFVGAAWAAGSAVASGVFVPMLLIGACIGRLVGLVTVDIAAAHGAGSVGAPPGVFLPPSPWAWIDPGAFALIGAGAFMGGVTRMTLALAVILMEMSNDVRILLPAMVAIALAKWVADLASHSLYHGLLEVKCVPFLPKTPSAGVSLDLVEVRHVAAAPVVTLRERVRLGDLRDVLRATRHNGFPVVRLPGGGGAGRKDAAGRRESGPSLDGGGGPDNAGGVFVGLVGRAHLLRLLLEAVRRGTAQHLEVPFAALDAAAADDPAAPGGGGGGAAAAAAAEQQLAVLDRAAERPASPAHFPAADARLWDEDLDLGPYINTSALAVPQTFSVERAFIVFATMGLRHLVVVDERNAVVGIVTRKDLLGYRLDAAVARARAGLPVSPLGSGGDGGGGPGGFD